VADAAVVDPRRVRRQRVGQPDLVDHPNVEADVHAEHPRLVKNTVCGRSGFFTGGRAGWRGRRRDGGHHVHWS